jgi:hypothetical protein
VSSRRTLRGCRGLAAATLAGAPLGAISVRLRLDDLGSSVFGARRDGCRHHCWRERRLGWRFVNDTDGKQLRRRGRPRTAATAARTTRTHSDSRRRIVRGNGRCRGGIRARHLFCHWRHFHCACDLEVITAPAQIDHTAIVRVLQYADEHSVAEAFAVAAEQFPGAPTNLAGSGRVVIVGGQRFDGASYEVERFVAREPLTANANDFTSSCCRPLFRDLQRCRNVDVCRRGAIAVTLRKLVTGGRLAQL